jgi:23S rRNA pseudouridine1911/1915/1917 synthase
MKQSIRLDPRIREDDTHREDDARYVVTPDVVGQRLDRFLADHLSDFSRAELQLAIRTEQVKVNLKAVLPKYKLKLGDKITLALQKPAVIIDQPEALPLRIVYEDEALLVINKPSGLTVHPGAGQASGTLLNALLYHDPALAALPRAGIVHRLDKDTAGLMVVAKTGEARLKLIEALKTHAVERVYVALVVGQVARGQTLRLPMGRHPVDRVKMAVLKNAAHAKEAITHIRILEKFATVTLIEARLETGRTHQIRVHLAHIGHPLVGDPVYGRKIASYPFTRQALQAERLSFIHPISGLKMDFQVPWEADFQALINGLTSS